MMSSFLLWAGVFLQASATSAVPSLATLRSDLTLLIDNDLEGANSSSANSGIILLSGKTLTFEDATSRCNALGEQLWRPKCSTSSIQHSLNYLVLQGVAQDNSSFWISPDQDGPRTINAAGRISYSASVEQQLPALCTQTAPFSSLTSADTQEKWRVTVHSNKEDLTGYRDRLSFRFLGIRYAPQPERFAYSMPYSGLGGAVSALNYGSRCPESGNVGTEDCLFLNVWTPYLPQQGNATDKRRLKAVMFWIHGGAFTGGTGNDPLMDGGNVASRGDVVLVTTNYRLGSLGFLALKDGATNGNFGLADQINALDWVRANIRDFGGDPDRITIFGQSAGAGSVRAMMASPKALGKFAGAIPMSNLGGLNYGTTYSKYYTIDQGFDAVGRSVLEATGCSTAEDSHLDCLRALPATNFTSIGPVARFLVVDGTYLTTPQLELSSNSSAGSGGGALPFKLMMGITHEDGAPFISYPKTTDEAAYLNSAGYAVPSPALFPIPDTTENATLNLYNMSSRLATDAVFRCVDQATVSAGLNSGRLGDRVYYYEFDRTYQMADWPRTDACEPPRTAERPLGDATLPYLRCHSGELYYVFGNLARQGRPPRDGHDLPFMRFVVDSFASFARTHDPNPDEAFLVARGYGETLAELRARGRWVPSTRGNLTLRALDWPAGPGQVPFRELPQCESLGLGLDYYE